MSLDYLFTKLSYWNDTTCIRSHNLDLIEQALSRIFEQEGLRRIPQPPLPQNPLPVLKKLYSQPWEIEQYLRVIGLFVGNLGWTIVKTSSSRLLCKRPRGAIRPRLAELAMQTGCDAFHYSVQDRTWGALLETDACGQTFASGYLDCYDIKEMKFYDEAITELAGGLHFFLLNVPEELQAASRVPTKFKDKEVQKRKQELEELYQQGEEHIAIAWAEWKQLCQSGFERTDEALGRLLTNSSHYWHLHNLLYEAYSEPQQLAAEGARLLYFQSARIPNLQEIWEAISNSPQKDEDDIPW